MLFRVNPFLGQISAKQKEFLAWTYHAQNKNNKIHLKLFENKQNFKNQVYIKLAQ